jgi:hypothetical protein
MYYYTMGFGKRFMLRRDYSGHKDPLLPGPAAVEAVDVAAVDHQAVAS